jgi:uncharacterized protein (DUF433 family)
MKNKFYKKITEELESGNHPADVYEDLADQYGNLEKNEIFEAIVNVAKKEGK